MAETTIAPRPALEGIAVPGRYGRREGAAGVAARVLADCGIALVTARNGRQGDLAEAVSRAFGVALPTGARHAKGDALSFVGAGPGRWLAVARPAPSAGMEALLAPAAAGLAAAVDQSHGLVLMAISGPRARDALAKGVAVDLHPRAFGAGHAAATLVAHIGVTLWQVDEAPTFHVCVPRAYSSSFWHWLLASAAEYGFEVGA